MRYLIALAAVVCLAGNAFAATPIKGTVVKGGKNPGGGYTAQKAQPDDPATTPGTCDHAINTKGRAHRTCAWRIQTAPVAIRIRTTH